MKLNDQQINVVQRSPGQNLLAALELADQGWNVFPLRPGSKAPLIAKAQGGNGAHDGTTDPDQIIEWWTRVPNAGIGANLGDDRIAFDIDLQHGGQRLKAFPVTRTHLSGRGNGNSHLIYRYTPGSLASQIQPKTAGLGRGLDIKVGRGAYIVVPPTRHESTGLPYQVSDENGGVEHLLTDDEVLAIWAEAGVSFGKKSPKVGPLPAGSGGTVGQIRSGEVKLVASPRGGNPLTDLLKNPPTEGGRNDWLTRVAGYYAREHRQDRETYDVALRLANSLLDDPLESWEVEKTGDSIWETEQLNHQERMAHDGNGYLVGDGQRLMCQVMIKEGDKAIPALAQFADFDIEALGVAVDDLDRLMFWVRLTWNGKQVDTTLSAEILGDDRATRKWLAARGMTADQPMNAIPRTPLGVRIMRYLNSQNPTKVKIVETLGWHDELRGFVTHEGLIGPQGFQKKELAGVVSDPRLMERDVAPFSYGFEESWPKAQAVLREVLTFQDQEVASVFGAWWAACLLKPQIQTRTSLFPFFGVEAVSESGKTNGFFDLMVQLNGNTRGQIAPTRPVLRDYSSANRNGIVWADDLDSLEPYGELLRASTSNGTAAKMDMDRNGIRNTQVVAPILISGESLGMNQQKALMDRSVVLNVPSPKGRLSARGDWPQWEDVLDLMAEFPKEQGGLSVLAGWFVQEAIKVSDKTMEALKVAKREGSGRQNDKLAVIRAGSRLLDWFCGHEDAFEGRGDHSRAVEGWIEKQSKAGWLDRDNTLTTQILPWALRTWGSPTFPQAGPDSGRFAGIDTPVFIRNAGSEENWESEPEVWVSVSLLAASWARDRNHRVESRTETEQALKQQADALGSGAGKAFHLSGSAPKRKGWYRQIPAEYAKVVVARSNGEEAL